MLRPKHHLYLHVISAQNTVGYFRVTFQPPMPSRPWFYWLFGEAFKECRGIPSILLNQFKIPQRILNILHLLLWTLFHLWVLFLGLIIIHAHVQTYLIIKRLFYSHLFFPNTFRRHNLLWYPYPADTEPTNHSYPHSTHAKICDIYCHYRIFCTNATIFSIWYVHGNISTGWHRSTR